MPVQIGKKTYKGHNTAVAAVVKTKGLSKEAAHKYVASIENKQKKKKK